MPQSMEFHWRKAAVSLHRRCRSSMDMEASVSFRYCSFSSSSSSAIPGQGDVTTTALVTGASAWEASILRMDWLLSWANLREAVS